MFFPTNFGKQVWRLQLFMFFQISKSLRKERHLGGVKNDVAKIQIKGCPVWSKIYISQSLHVNNSVIKPPLCHHQTIHNIPSSPRDRRGVPHLHSVELTLHWRLNSPFLGQAWLRHGAVQQQEGQPWHWGSDGLLFRIWKGKQNCLSNKTFLASTFRPFHWNHELCLTWCYSRRCIRKMNEHRNKPSVVQFATLYAVSVGDQSLWPSSASETWAKAYQFNAKQRSIHGVCFTGHLSAFPTKKTVCLFLECDNALSLDVL